MKKIAFDNPTQLNEILSLEGYIILFKHSTRCPISSMALNRIESHSGLAQKEIPFYLLDLIQHRSLSNAIAQQFNVVHESPQLLLIKDGECILDASHTGISADEVLSMLP